MAKKAYIGVNNVARKIKKMYIGVNGVARKIKKAYIGVNGVARLFFEPFEYTNFTSSVIPTSWTNNSGPSYNNYSATDNYGTWNVSATINSSHNVRILPYMFDSNTNKYYAAASNGSSSGYLDKITLKLPNNVAMKPSHIHIYSAEVGASSSRPSKVLGKNAETGAWETIYTLTNGSSSVQTNDAELSLSNYYSEFEFDFYCYSSSHIVVYQCYFTAGTMRKAN